MTPLLTSTVPRIGTVPISPTHDHSGEPVSPTVPTSLPESATADSDKLTSVVIHTSTPVVTAVEKEGSEGHEESTSRSQPSTSSGATTESGGTGVTTSRAEEDVVTVDGASGGEGVARSTSGAIDIPCPTGTTPKIKTPKGKMSMVAILKVLLCILGVFSII